MEIGGVKFKLVGKVFGVKLFVSFIVVCNENLIKDKFGEYGYDYEIEFDGIVDLFKIIFLNF